MAAQLPPALADLVAERRWLVWRWETTDRGKATKVPYRGASPGQKASSTDAKTWCDYATAAAVVAAGKADGIGFALYESGFAAFDIDDCRDRETHEIAAWAMRLIERAGSYAEVTVSGTGVRIIGHAAGAYVHRNQPVPGEAEGRIETYRSASRYIVVTGTSLDDPPTALADIDPLIDETVSWLDAAKQAKADAERAERQRAKADRTRFTSSRGDIPPDLDRLIRFGVVDGERSSQFHHVVGWLKDLGWSASDIETELAYWPNGIAQKYAGRLRAEIDRSFGRTEEPRGEQRGTGSGGTDQRRQTREPPREIPLHWHRDADPNAERAWLVRDTIGEVGKGLLAGQWGTYKTFIVLDLSGCVMTGEAFAGRRVLRRGGVLFIAPEGAFEIPIRLRGLVEGKLRGAALARTCAGEEAVDPADLPIAWIEECPRLVDDGAIDALLAVADRVRSELRQRYGLPLALVVVDTVAAGAGFDDENSAAETQKAMNALERLSQHTGAFVLGVDHFGKAVETGTRGSSAKEAAADTVLAALGTKDEAGNVTNTRLAVRKVRGARTGQEIPYGIEVVEIGTDRWGDALTTCVVQWQTEREATETVKAKDRWTAALRVFRTALVEALDTHGIRAWPFGGTGPEHRATPLERVRAAFYAIYPASGETEAQRSETKRKQFNRMVAQAQGKDVVGSIELNGVDHLWLKPEPGQAST